jgi:hypothetical protein
VLQGSSIVRLVEDYKAALAPTKPLKDKGLGKKSRDSLPSESPPNPQQATGTKEKEGQG